MDSKWTRFCSIPWSFPKYSWADAEDSDSESDTSESEPEHTIIEYYEQSKSSIFSDDTCNDETYLSGKSDNGSIEDDNPDMPGEWVQEEKNGVQAILYKRFCKRTPLSQLVLHKSAVRHAKMKCFFSDGELGSLSDACDQEGEILWCIMTYYS